MYPNKFVISFAIFGLNLVSAYSADPVVVEVSDLDADRTAREIESKVSIVAAEGIEATLWASEDLMNDPVGIDIDDNGDAWLSVTLRRKSSMFDIRAHTDWIPESWNWETIEERQAFLRDELSPENSDKNGWLSDMNGDGSRDWRDLYVEDEEVYRVQDISGNGRANKSTRFTWIPSTELTDIAGTVLAHDGDVFLGLPPDMWRVRDMNGDGTFESIESLSTGYGIHIGFGGHGMSGAKVGPDGKIYWGIGDVGFSDTDKSGKRWHFPRQGVLVRSEPDGSDFEVYAHGLRNVHEFDWDEFGNLIGVDNDGDFAGEEERIVYLINGSDTGWRNNWQVGKYTDPKNNGYRVWMDERYFRPRFEDQAAHFLPTLSNYHTGPAGMVYNPGSALGEEWKGHFFVASFTGNAANSGINAFSLKPSGASFELNEDRELMHGVTSVGIDFGPDGALYLADWVEGWDTDGIGRIWKLDSEANRGSERQAMTKRLLGEDFKALKAADLLKLLSDDDRRVRLKAQFELAKRGDEKTLAKALRDRGNQLARIHGLWGIGQIGRRNVEALAPLLTYLRDSDPEIRAQTARLLGDVRYGPALNALIDSLNSETNPRILLMATEALGRLGDAIAFDPVVRMVEANEDSDVYLRAAGAIALARLDDGSRLAAFAKHESRAVRIAAVVALGRLGHAGVANFLDDDDEFVVTNAARVINDDEHILEAVPELAEKLLSGQFSNEAFVRRAINANWYSGTEADANRLAGFANGGGNDLAMRIESINTLSNWVNGSIYDRVSGRIRPVPQNRLSDAQLALASVTDGLLSESSEELVVAAVEAIGNLGIKSEADSLLALLEGDSTEGVQIASLRALKSLSYSDLNTVVERVLREGSPGLRRAAMAMLPDLVFEDSVMVALFGAVLETGSLEDQQVAMASLGALKIEAATAELVKQFERLESGALAPGLQLDLVRAIEANGSPELLQRKQSWESKSAEFGAMAQYGFALYGGDAERGKAVVYNAPAAQCIRCHAIEGQGGDVGPDLAGIGKRLNRMNILQSLVDPSAKIANGFGTVGVTTKSGQSLLGLLKLETTDSLTLHIEGTGEVVVKRSDIASLVSAPSSMPPMGFMLKKEELRDVVAFLAELKESELAHGTH